MTQAEFRILFEKYRSEEISEEEFRALWETLADETQVEDWRKAIDDMLNDGAVPDLSDPAKGRAILEKILKRPAKHVTMRPWKTWAAAAALILMLGIGFLWRQASVAPNDPVLVKETSDIPPGGNGAILTLANGSTVVLDSLGNGLIAAQQGSQAILQNGQLEYEPSGGETAGLSYNTMRTPNGRQFRLKLPDGTLVWLNAASSIRYPVAFTGKERRVEVQGEAYFEVTENAQMPFIVDADHRTEITVLGTQFNVNAYDDEPTLNTTLLQGRVRITAAGKNVELKPGQQAQVSRDQQIKTANDANLDKAVAWKNGTFNFEGSNLREIMRQLERWYDIKVVYEKDIPPTEYFGEISKRNNLQGVLRILEKSEVRFRLENNNTLVVTR
ncbi:FecR family protein [Chitinophaga sp. GCM10012297]|uniref:FecR domain-containing protein n=1 Tax=Chitinophaga chungangae TaxID=2821488 RepID=A0ABS3Y7W3_9BACT|nr:FecR family protein [Chitinophaga chungangae]MBO9150769.1 FecR domain-containing protein [Chitinophaga chungangae]